MSPVILGGMDMSVKDEYLEFRMARGLRTRSFDHRVLLQRFLRDRLDDIWAENPGFSHGGLLSNYMTGLALGFAYYDCQPSSFCRTRCYGLPLSGVYDYYMLRLGVITSESLKSGDPRFTGPLSKQLSRLDCLKIGHWGDAVLEQVPVIASLVTKHPRTVFWWYTRKKEVAAAANECDLPNLRAYLSLDPATDYPPPQEYPFGITYLLGDGLLHPRHAEILQDDRLVAVFPLKKGASIEDPEDYGIETHPGLCEEKALLAEFGQKGDHLCLSCRDRCNYRPGS